MTMNSKLLFTRKKRGVGGGGGLNSGLIFYFLCCWVFFSAVLKIGYTITKDRNAFCKQSELYVNIKKKKMYKVHAQEQQNKTEVTFTEVSLFTDLFMLSQFSNPKADAVKAGFVCQVKA